MAHGASNHRQLDCFSNSLFRLTKRKSNQTIDSLSRITAKRTSVLVLCERNPPVTGGFPSQSGQQCIQRFHIMTSACPIDVVSVVKGVDPLVEVRELSGIGLKHAVFTQSTSTPSIFVLTDGKCYIL